MIGKLNRRIKVKSTGAPVIDEAGGVSNGAVVVDFETFAQVTPKKSTWLVMQGMEHLGNTYEITIRWASQRVLDVTKIIEYEGKDLILKGVVEQQEGKKRFLIITAYEQAPQLQANG